MRGPKNVLVQTFLLLLLLCKNFGKVNRVATWRLQCQAHPIPQTTKSKRSEIPTEMATKLFPQLFNISVWTVLFSGLVLPLMNSQIHNVIPCSLVLFKNEFGSSFRHFLFRAERMLSGKVLMQLEERMYKLIFGRWLSSCVMLFTLQPLMYNCTVSRGFYSIPLPFLLMNHKMKQKWVEDDSRVENSRKRRLNVRYCGSHL